MKKLILLFVFACQAFGAWGNGYTYRRTLTIDKAMVPNTDQTNFPVLFSGTYSYLAHTTHSGLATDLNGYDIIFTSDAAGTTKLDHEIETYAHDTGVCVFWVRVPSVTTAANTVIYLFYTNSSVTTSQQAITGVWNSAYKGVWHMADNAATKTVVESTSNAHNGTNVANTDTKTIAGQVARALDYASGSDSTNMGNNSVYDFTETATIEFWLKYPSISYGSKILNRMTYNVGGWDVEFNAANADLVQYTNDSGNNYPFDMAGAPLSADAWQHCVVVFDYSGGSHIRRWYFNGASNRELDSNAYGEPPASISLNLVISGDQALSMDEIRLSNVVRSADWIHTEYHNQSDPSTFYALGAETENSGIRRRVVIVQ